MVPNPTPTPETALGYNVETLRLLLTFAAAMFGAVIGQPIVELFKDILGAKRQWTNQRNEIVSTLRFVMGSLDAFHEIRRHAFPKVVPHKPPMGGGLISPIDFERLRKFDLNVISGSLPKLSSLTPRTSEKSKAGQRLIQYLLSIRSYFEAVQAIVPHKTENTKGELLGLALSEDDEQLVKDSDSNFTDFRNFVASNYAQKLEVQDSFSFLTDPEVVDTEIINLDRKVALELETLAKMRADYQKDIEEQTQKLERAERSRKTTEEKREET
jgi:hypothetical protein